MRHAPLNRAVRGPLRQAFYRLFDVACAAAGLLLLTPVLAVLALVILCGDGPPVFFGQTRVGRKGKPFRIWKFRTMRTGIPGMVITAAGDPRVTRAGAVLRRCKLDELPQLFNVLKGDMSLVGPRPERPVFIQQFSKTIPNYMARHCVKAGITGWAQVHGWRGNTSLRKRLQYDLYYITHWTPWLDLRILVMTVFKGLLHRNAY